jgi:hypothetical protein
MYININTRKRNKSQVKWRKPQETPFLPSPNLILGSVDLVM